MADPRAVARLRAELLEELAPLAPLAQSRLLAAALADPNEVRAAFALLVFAQRRFEPNARFLSKRLPAAVQVFADLARQGPRHRRFFHDARLVEANVHLRYGRRPAAVRILRRLLDASAGSEVRVLARLNLSRALFSDGRLADAWDLAAARAPRAASAEHAFLLKVRKLRILLALGFRERSLRALADLRATGVSKGTAELERRYLGLVLRFERSPIDSFFRRYEEFLAWLEGKQTAGVAAFYKLELLLLRQVFASAKPRYPDALIARARSLSREAGCSDLYPLFRQLVRFQARRGGQGLELVLDQLRQLDQGENQHLLHLVVVGLAARLLGARRRDQLARLEVWEKRRCRRLQAGFSASVVAALRADRLPTFDWLDRAFAACKGTTDADPEALLLET